MQRGRVAMSSDLSASQTPKREGERPLWAALDVQYVDPRGYTGCLVVSDWGADRADEETVYVHEPVAPYRSGFFYERELPCLLGALETCAALPRHILVDGYVQLPKGRKGLGQHLFEALDGKAVIIGVSKTKFLDDDVSIAVLRGESQQPLYVTAMGIDVRRAAKIIESLHGRFRIPTLLKRVDRLARDSVPTS